MRPTWSCPAAARTAAQEAEILQKQMNSLNRTLNHAENCLGAETTGISDDDTDEDVTVKVSGCLPFLFIFKQTNFL